MPRPKPKVILADAADHLELCHPPSPILPRDSAIYELVVQPKIVGVLISESRPWGGACMITATFDDGQVKGLLHYYPDEITFTAEELIGKTEEEARHLHYLKDRVWLTGNSP